MRERQTKQDKKRKGHIDKQWSTKHYAESYIEEPQTDGQIRISRRLSSSRSTSDIRRVPV